MSVPLRLVGDEVLPPMDPTPPRRERPRRRKGADSSGRFGVLNGFVDESMATLTAGAVRSWLVLFREVRPPHGTARIGQADIARRAGLTKRSVVRAIQELEAAGLVKTVLRGNNVIGPSAYRVLGHRAVGDVGVT